MGDKTVALKRDDFNTFSEDTLRGLFEDSDLIDVTLACSYGKQVMAHKVVLSAGSDYFHKLLKQNKHTRTPWSSCTTCLNTLFLSALSMLEPARWSKMSLKCF